VKLFTAAILSALCIAAPAAAQSLEETHERVWMPAGKSQMLTWRMRDRPEGVAIAQHHQAGKGQMPVAIRAKDKVKQVSARRAEAENTGIE